MTEVTLEFTDGEIIKVVLLNFIATEWRDGKKLSGNIKKCGDSIIEFKELTTELS